MRLDPTVATGIMVVGAVAIMVEVVAAPAADVGRTAADDAEDAAAACKRRD